MPQSRQRVTGDGAPGVAVVAAAVVVVICAVPGCPRSATLQPNWLQLCGKHVQKLRDLPLGLSFAVAELSMPDRAYVDTATRDRVRPLVAALVVAELAKA